MFKRNKWRQNISIICKILSTKLSTIKNCVVLITIGGYFSKIEVFNSNIVCEYINWWIRQ